MNEMKGMDGEHEEEEEEVEREGQGEAGSLKGV